MVGPGSTREAAIAEIEGLKETWNQAKVADAEVFKRLLRQTRATLTLVLGPESAAAAWIDEVAAKKFFGTEAANSAINSREGKRIAIQHVLEIASAELNQRPDLPRAMVSRVQSKRVFVVHGHDKEIRKKVTQLLRDWELEPIVLEESPTGGSLTIIEKLESEGRVPFAIVLMTPDEKLVIPSDDLWEGDRKVRRARQNVVLELGYFVGHLGRSRVVALEDNVKDFELPSDIDGVIRIRVNNLDWTKRLHAELRKAGLLD